MGLVVNGKVYSGSRGLVEGGHMVRGVVVGQGMADRWATPRALEQLSLTGDVLGMSLAWSQIVQLNGRACGCGQKGCLETYASANSVAARAAEALSRSGEWC